jgi:hypothetical protein
MKKAGHSAAYILGLWDLVVSAAAALFGYLFLAGASGDVVTVHLPILPMRRDLLEGSRQGSRVHLSNSRVTRTRRRVGTLTPRLLRVNQV